MKLATQAKLATIAIAVTALLAVDAAAAVPTTIHLEGYLHTTGGGPVADGSYNLTFTLFDAKTSGKSLWSESASGVAVKGGQWSHVLGSSKPVTPGALAGGKVWLEVKVGTDTLPRVKLHSSFYAHTAASLSCTGCIKAAHLDLKGGAVTAKEFIGDGSKLTGIKIPSGKCPSGQVVTGIDGAGKLICGSASPLPDDGVDKVSQGLVAIVGDLYHGNAPVGINDNNPKGSQSVITLKNVGKVDKLTVTVDLKITSGNSGINKLKVCLIAPGGAIPNNAGFNKDYCTAKNQYLLHNLSGAGKTLLSTWPSPTKEVSGNIAEWIGKDPSGNWTVQVVDTNFDTNKVIGALEKFQISARTTGNNKVNVVKELIVDGEQTANKGVKLGMSTKKCDASTDGLMRYDKMNKRMEYCDGTAWRYFGHKPAQYRWNVLHTYNNAHWGWAFGNDKNSFGGVHPSTWTDGNGRADQMSSDTQTLLTLFNRKGYGGWNATVWHHVYNQYSSTTGQVVWVLFRVKNHTTNNINWKINWSCTGWTGWSERCSGAINGSNIWNGNCGGGICNHGHTVTIPKSRTSTLIFVATGNQDTNSSHHGRRMRGTALRFYNNTLKLPTGLEFVDDLDSKPNGWSN